MTEPRDSRRDAPEDDGEGRSSRIRRLAPAKLAGSTAAALLALGLAWVVSSTIVRTMTDWVDARPEHRLAFAEIELVPRPPLWIRTGAAGILHSVRVESRREEHVSIPGLDLEEFRKDFRRCPWVEDVPGVVRSYGRLAVRLVYRKPVAVAAYDGELVLVIDKDGVILPPDDIDWIEKGTRFRIRGIDEPLMTIRDVPRPASTVPGLPWKRADTPEALGDRDPMVVGAARLAAFFQGRPRVTPAGKAAPAFVAIWPDPESRRYFLKDGGDHWVFWDSAPGAEPLGGPTAVEKWSMLLDWIDRHGPLTVGAPAYLRFERSGAEIFPGRRAARGPGGTR